MLRAAGCHVIGPQKGCSQEKDESGKYLHPRWNALFIRTLTDKTIIVPLTDDVWRGTVMELKQRIHDKEGIPPDQQRLVFGGNDLEDQEVFEDACMGRECEITLHLAAAADPEHCEAKMYAAFLAQPSDPSATSTCPQAVLDAATAIEECVENAVVLGPGVTSMCLGENLSHAVNPDLSTAAVLLSMGYNAASQHLDAENLCAKLLRLIPAAMKGTSTLPPPVPLALLLLGRVHHAQRLPSCGTRCIPLKVAIDMKNEYCSAPL
ncbi:hypothetical protein CYMTET_8473 [Cymbomonas tetramitiformis]|uniref:Ubiquitin-like domain-containing protein n=1 Tax=Cymbomonas tetramitiformis TaxID=36881 RepID=A0AAE0LG15_9CHLO|nr:hypothetical protein CYMTET_8473 [Cymbomonas tetramitiformis]